jgi:hypothetical protein
VREQKPAARILIADDHQLLAVTTTRQGYRTTSLQVGSPSGMPHHHGHKGRDAGMLDRAPFTAVQFPVARLPAPFTRGVPL